MVTQDDYRSEELDACRSVLIELIHLLGDFKNEIAIVGGWVPQLLLPTAGEPHVGTLDVDIAFDFENISDDTYKSLLKLLTERGYQQSEQQPFIFHRVVQGSARPITVEIDFLSGEYGGTGKRHRTQEVQNVRARKARGCDLVFEQTVTVKIEGTLPAGGKDEVSCQIAGVVPFIIMKSMALADRIKEKDAYDIDYVLRYYPGGIQEVVKAFEAFISHGLVQEGLKKLRSKFQTPDHVGPKWVVDFLGITDNEQRAARQRQAYATVDQFLSALGVAATD